ncbi:response regulator receiver modulated metal dependent phosphohydrolase [Kosmotoga olearia TBF 19.5.1]|uniref:Response regulator receiver modulated metal dependent phosphohydrolase n=2 Tax=Kosmotoga TaxID=651456 RepID=C5CHY4_KOSOT|nr:response regulator receiver modulated metal dependent phosphohydrolase [Kosmotoga olearia TBF 19.5.1]
MKKRRLPSAVLGTSRNLFPENFIPEIGKVINMKILAVDDNKENIYMLETLFKSYGYEVESSQNGVEALEKLAEQDFDVVISDILMPEMDGFQLCRRVKMDDRLKEIPFILYTAAYTDPEDRKFALSLGVDRFIIKPLEPDAFVKIVREVIQNHKVKPLNNNKVVNKEEIVYLKNYNERLIKKLEDGMLQLEEKNKELEQSYKKVQRTLDSVVETIGLVIEMRDAYTSGHQRRVSQLACAIAREMNLSEEQIEAVRIAGLLHDIGKISIPTDILNKPDKLNKFELGIVRNHPQTAFEILKDVEFSQPIAEIVLQHHERIDGSGYPNGLKGNQILTEAKILAVSDVVEAMAFHRPYRPALGIAKALEEITTNSGNLYDPETVKACIAVFSRGFDFEKER